MILRVYTQAWDWEARDLSSPSAWVLAMLWAESGTPIKYLEVPTPSTLECDLIWRQGLYRVNQVKMSSLVWTIIQYDCCPYKKRKFRHRHTKGRRPYEMKTEDGVIYV